MKKVFLILAILAIILFVSIKRIDRTSTGVLITFITGNGYYIEL